MGADMQTKKTMHCVLHGDYIKFVTDPSMACPHCESENLKKSEEKAIEKQTIQSQSELVEVVMMCDTHGEKRIEVPRFMAKMARHCPDCVGVKRDIELKPLIQQTVNEELKKTGIPENYIGQTFAGLDDMRSPKQRLIVGRLIQYVKDLISTGHSEGAKNILLSGNLGTGKTLYASILLQAVLNRALADGVQDERDIRLKGRLSVKFVSEPNLLNQLTAIWKSNTDTQKAMIARLAEKSILVIDDVGTISSTNTHLLDLYANLLDERYKRRLPTIITSNLMHDDLKLAIGARSADRFFEKNRVIIANFDWGSYRAGTSPEEIEMF